MTNWIEWGFIFVAIAGLIGLFINRIVLKKGFSERTLQLLGLTLIVPTIVILAVEKIIDSQIVSTLLGAVAGFVLSGIKKED